MGSMKQDVVQIHLYKQKKLNELAVQIRQRQVKLEQLRKTLMEMKIENRIEEEAGKPGRDKLRVLRARVAAVEKQQRQRDADDAKLSVLVKRTEQDLLNSLGKLQDIGYFNKETVKALTRGKRNHRYNALIVERSQVQLNQMHRSFAESKFQFMRELGIRRKQMGVLGDLDTQLKNMLQEKELADKTKDRQAALVNKRKKQQKLKIIGSLNDAVGLVTRVDAALDGLRRCGHDVETLDDVFRVLFEMRRAQIEAIEQRTILGQKVVALNLEVDALRKTLHQERFREDGAVVLSIDKNESRRFLQLEQRVIVKEFSNSAVRPNGDKRRTFAEINEDVRNSCTKTKSSSVQLQMWRRWITDVLLEKLPPDTTAPHSAPWLDSDKGLGTWSQKPVGQHRAKSCGLQWY